MITLNSIYNGRLNVKFSRVFRLFLSCVIGLVCMADIAAGVSNLSDKQKRETVYRMFADYRKKFPVVSDISPQQTMKLYNQGKVVLVDIRRPEEMAVSMLPCAVSGRIY